MEEVKRSEMRRVEARTKKMKGTMSFTTSRIIRRRVRVLWKREKRVKALTPWLRLSKVRRVYLVVRDGSEGMASEK